MVAVRTLTVRDSLKSIHTVTEENGLETRNQAKVHEPGQTPTQQENQIFAQLVSDDYLWVLLACCLHCSKKRLNKYIFFRPCLCVLPSCCLHCSKTSNTFFQAFATCLFNFGFGLGLGNIFFVLVGEVHREYFQSSKTM